MPMHPTRFGVYLLGLVVVIWILIIFNPTVIWSVDPILVVGPMFFAFFILFYYFYSEGHRWAYSLVTHQCHSSTSEGKPSFLIPAMNNYPEMVGFAKGGSRLFNMYGFGGKLDGFLIVPKHQVINISGHHTANTITRDIYYTALPPHIREVLERDHRFDPRGMVEFGLVPLIKNIHREYFSNLMAPDLELLLDQSHEENYNLRQNIQALHGDIRSLTDVIGSIGEGLRDVPTEAIKERVKRGMGGDEDGR